MWFWLFIASACLNIFLILYVRWLLKQIESFNDQVKDLSEMVLSFSDHLDSVYELELFYGDDTLKALMEHSRQLSENLSNLDLILNETEEEQNKIEEEKA